MQLETKKYLYDIQKVAKLIKQFSYGKNFTDYQADPLLRSGLVWSILQVKLPILMREVDKMLSVNSNER
jgi:hypothetical protein